MSGAAAGDKAVQAKPAAAKSNKPIESRKLVESPKAGKSSEPVAHSKPTGYKPPFATDQFEDLTGGSGLTLEKIN